MGKHRKKPIGVQLQPDILEKVKLMGGKAFIIRLLEKDLVCEDKASL